MEKNLIEMTNYIQSFIDNFQDKYNKKLKVVVLKSNKKNADEDVSKIKILENLVLKAMHNKHPELSHIRSLKVTSRRREVIIWVQIYSYLAYELGYTLMYIGQSINRNHATVIHSIKVAKDLLSIKETGFIEVYELVLKSIQEYVGIISTNVKGGYDTKSILNSLRDKEESVITLA